MTRLEFLRRNLRAPQTTMAKALGISQTTLSAVERGMRPSNQLLKQIADYFGVTPEELMTPVPEVPEQQARAEEEKK